MEGAGRGFRFYLDFIGKMIFGFFRKELRGGAFLVQLLEGRCFLQVLSGGIVSGWVCTSTKVVFLFLPFSLERKRKKQGEPTNGSPLTPFQRPTGAKQR